MITTAKVTLQSGGRLVVGAGSNGPSKNKPQAGDPGVAKPGRPGLRQN